MEFIIITCRGVSVKDDLDSEERGRRIEINYTGEGKFDTSRRIKEEIINT